LFGTDCDAGEQLAMDTSTSIEGSLAIELDEPDRIVNLNIRE
jgi:hypothetical protein